MRQNRVNQLRRQECMRGVRLVDTSGTIEEAPFTESFAESKRTAGERHHEAESGQLRRQECMHGVRLVDTSGTIEEAPSTESFAESKRTAGKRHHE
eukprot:Cvel_2551.t1-p1 / transcript=Cvel_2551.t1 / gene=Cvel_2551 / organism=Chromera_velia_CCMP2878 / gene_product=hypothetical protein / transcript_product=hypothetical protein / location=Cvel_scaffold100:128702-133144(+) / protein_length=95 / sequence_SO=supercontig / SO=protein_coding / is_pseudo=false